jgi:thiol-disulfide isomerase/thioredoxin
MKKLALVLLVVLCSAAAFAEELAVGAKAVPFALQDAVTGRKVTFEPGKGPAVVVFTCNSCPYAKAFEARIIELGRAYAARGVAFYAIDPNDDSAYPSESLDKMKERATARNYPFPYLKDGDSSIARAYGARVTPHVFVVDAKGIVRYRGYVDDSAKPEERHDTGLSNAVDALLSGGAIRNEATRAFGCTIKWKEAAK